MLGFLQHLGEQLGPWFYVIAGGLACAEAALMVGLVLPGETALVVAGFAAHHGWIALWPMVAVAVGSAALGDSIGYEVGRRLGPRLRSSSSTHFAPRSPAAICAPPTSPPYKTFTNCTSIF